MSCADSYHFLRVILLRLVPALSAARSADLLALQEQHDCKGRVGSGEPNDDEIVVIDMDRVIVGKAEVVEVAHVRVKEPKNICLHNPLKVSKIIHVKTCQKNHRSLSLHEFSQSLSGTLPTSSCRCHCRGSAWCSTTSRARRVSGSTSTARSCSLKS